jgi:hypothetical protein
MKVTILQLVAILAPFQSHQFDGVQTLKVEKTLKKDRKTLAPFSGTITVRGQYQSGIGFDYQKAVNNKRKAEGLSQDFEANSLPWGSWLEGSKTIITHKGKFYPRQTHGLGVKKQYALNGVPTDKKDLPDVLPATRAKNRSQGLETPVIVTTHCLSNVTKITVDGTTYELIDNDASRLS